MPRTAMALGVVIALALAAPAPAAAPPFKTGTFSGTAGGKAASIKIYAGTCKRKPNNATRVKGYCFQVKRFPVLESVCPDGTVRKSNAFSYDVALKPSGRYEDNLEMVSSAVKDQVYERRTLAFKAGGTRITGTATWQATSTGGSPRTTPGLDCSKATARIVLKR